MSVVIPKEKTRKAKLPSKEGEIDQSTKQSSDKQSTKPSKKRSAEQSNDQSESPAKKSKKNAKSSSDQSVKQESVKQENQSDNVSSTPSINQSDNQTESAAKKKRKRRRSLAAVAPTSLDTAELETAAPSIKSNQSNQTIKEEKKRYIVFVGNLPYRCSKESLAKFFDVADASVRIPTNKENNKPKGFAFVEFTDPFGLQRALKLHHTEFQERKINVELTAGGGGNTENRTKKIADRNAKLTKQRKNAADKRAVEKTNNQSNEKSNDQSQAQSKKESAEQSTEQSDEPAKKKRKRKPKKKADADAADSE